MPGAEYPRDRAFTLKNSVNIDTEGMMDKSIFDYRQYELASNFLWLFLTYVINDGRTVHLFASRSYLNSEILSLPIIHESKKSACGLSDLLLKTMW